MKKFIILLVVIFCANFVSAQDFEFYKLENGQNVIIEQVKTNPIVTIDTWIKTGSINENDKNNGVAHFLEHLFFKGTKAHPAGEFDRILETKGAFTNAATSKDFTHYYITLPSNHFDLAMSLHADMLLKPQIPRKEMEKERKVVLEEIAKDLNNPSNIAYNNLNSMLYKTHPYKRKVIGTPEVIENITREEILNFYNKYYTPSNMVTVIVGDVTPEHALSAVKENFSAVSKKIKQPKYTKEKPLFKKAKQITYAPSKSGYMLIGWHGVDAKDKDSYALDVLATILGDGKSSVLNRIIKEQSQLAFDIYATHSSLKDDSLFIVGANFSPDKYEKVEQAIYKEIDNIKKHGVTQDALDTAKSIIERDTYYSRESVSSIANQIGYSMILTGDIKFYNEYLKNIQDVTAQDVKWVANKYLWDNKSAISVVLPETMKAQTVEKQSTTSIDAKLVSQNFGVKKYLLPDKLTLLVNENKQNDIIAMTINAKGGGFLERISGTGSLMAAVMLKGTEKYSFTELSQILEENGIKISPAATADSFNISVLTTKPKLGQTLELLDEVLNNALFDDYEIEKTRANKMKSIIKSRDTAINVAFEGYKTAIFEGSPYSVTSAVLEKTLPQIQREDVLEYYEKVFAPENVVISVNGDVDSQQLIDKFSAIFADKKGAKFDWKPYATKIPTLKSAKTVIKKMPENKASWIIMGWQTSGVLAEKDYATLQIIDAILGSGMSSRLFRNLRDQEGLAYQIGSSFSPNVLKGNFAVYIGTNPKNIAIAKQKMLDEVFRFKTEFVSDKELQEAKEKLLGNYLISLETNLEKASSVGWFEASGRGYEFQEKYKTLINNVTASDIIEVANKYFTNNFVISIAE